jgi:hypothetical protein
MDGISMKPKMKQVSYAVSKMDMEISFLSYFSTRSGFGIVLTSRSG